MRARRPGMKLDHQPADKLFADFAMKPLHYIDHSTGEVVAWQVFVANLPFSDYSFAIAVPSQRIADFLHALGCCLQHIGGTPKVLVPINLKSAIIKADRYEPDVNCSLEDFTNHSMNHSPFCCIFSCNCYDLDMGKF